jgi:flagellin
MRINSNIPSLIAQGALYTTNQSLSTSLERLSTGLRINHASDDAAGLGVSENLMAQVNGVTQAQRNAQDGIAALNIADGAANEITSVLQRMRELAVQTSNDTLTSTERGYSQQEYSALQSEIDRIAASANYNKQSLLTSTAASRFGNMATGSALWIDANHTYGTDSITISISTLTSNLLGVNSAATNLTTQAGSATAISMIDTAIDSVNSMRANVGAYVNRLEHAVNNLSVSETNQTAAESTIRDADFASETTSYTKSQILTQSATAMLAQANSLPSTVLALLK